MPRASPSPRAPRSRLAAQPAQPHGGPHSCRFCIRVRDPPCCTMLAGAPTVRGPWRNRNHTARRSPSASRIVDSMSPNDVSLTVASAFPASLREDAVRAASRWLRPRATPYANRRLPSNLGSSVRDSTRRRVRGRDSSGALQATFRTGHKAPPQILADNPAFWAKTKARIVSYWDCYYRQTWKYREDYVGFKLVDYFDSIRGAE